jgi:hypothetical protein
MVPVIFTTAVLYASDVRLDEAIIETGMLPTDQVGIQSREWLWFQFPVSSSLRHSLDRRHRPETMNTIGGVLDVEHSRSIAIVRVTGIERFLRSIGDAADLVDEVQ